MHLWTMFYKHIMVYIILRVREHEYRSCVRKLKEKVWKEKEIYNIYLYIYIIHVVDEGRPDKKSDLLATAGWMLRSWSLAVCLRQLYPFSLFITEPPLCSPQIWSFFSPTPSGGSLISLFYFYDLHLFTSHFCFLLFLFLYLSSKWQILFSTRY